MDEDTRNIRIPCECNQVYIWQRRHSIDTRLKEDHRHIRLEHLDKSVEAKNSINLGHGIQLRNTSILSTKPRYMDLINREATAI
jgi:hypothetical protein